jgi:hypothetical protein
LFAHSWLSLLGVGLRIFLTACGGVRVDYLGTLP